MKLGRRAGDLELHHRFLLEAQTSRSHSDRLIAPGSLAAPLALLPLGPVKLTLDLVMGTKLSPSK
jgi:hypothetical protein